MAERNQMPIRRHSGGWNPVREVSRLQRGIDRLFDDLLSPVFGSSLPSLSSDFDGRTFNPPMDVRDEDDQFVVSMDLPGIKKDDVRIEIQDGVMMISGERKEEKEDKGRQYSERFYGGFERTFSLPGNVKPEQIEASYEHGVLEIKMPKAETGKSRRIEIGAGERVGLAQQGAAPQAAPQKKTA